MRSEQKCETSPEAPPRCPRVLFGVAKRRGSTPPSQQHPERAPAWHILGDHSSPSESPTARVFPTGHPRHLPVQSFTTPAADVLTKHRQKQHLPGTALQTQQRDGTDGGKLLGRCYVSKDTIVGGKCKWTDPAERWLLRSSTMLHRCWSSGWHLSTFPRRKAPVERERGASVLVQIIHELGTGWNCDS